MYIQFYKLFNLRVRYTLILLSILLSIISIEFILNYNSRLKKDKIEHLSNYICKIIEPRLQIGATRDVVDFLTATTIAIDSKLIPIVKYSNNNKVELIGPILNNSNLVYTCSFVGISNIKINFFYKNESIDRLNLFKFYFLGFTIYLLFFVTLFYIVFALQKFTSDLIKNIIQSEFSDKKNHLPKLQNNIVNLLKLDGEIISDLKNQFNELKQIIQIQQTKIVEKSREETLVVVASQVSHDIRSPLAALNMTIANLKDIPEQQRITLRAASNRINDIANTLLTRAKDQKSETSQSGTGITNQGIANVPMKMQVELLPAILDTIVSEKRVQYRDKMQVEIEADFKNAYGAFANINPTELSRVISNLINNSVEALPDGKGKFTLSVVKESNQVVIFAQDNGKGIPAHILEKLGQMGVTHGKEGTQSGSGLGVYHAKTTIEQFGGKFEIQSTPNLGTKIIMTLPSAPAPKWFVEKIKISPQSQIISLDDDLSIHNVWKGRFQSLGFNQNEIQHLTFTSGLDFKDWVNNQPVSQSKNIQQRIYLVDYELLNQKQTGLDIVEELGIGSQSILVTSRYEELNIRERCEKLGIQLIPKGMAGLVPIELKQPLKHLDAILIDDDPLMGYVWTETAKTSNKSFEWFNDPELFFAKVEQYDPNVEIYIDVSLAKNVKGQDVAIKLSQMGFANLHLATGYEADSIDKPAVVKTIIGKDCPL